MTHLLHSAAVAAVVSALAASVPFVVMAGVVVAGDGFCFSFERQTRAGLDQV
jgi:hypothetical protein